MTLPKPPVTPFEWNPEIPNTRSSPTQQDNQDFMKCQTCDLQWGMDEGCNPKNKEADMVNEDIIISPEKQAHQSLYKYKYTHVTCV